MWLSLSPRLSTPLYCNLSFFPPSAPNAIFYICPFFFLPLSSFSSVNSSFETAFPLIQSALISFDLLSSPLVFSSQLSPILSILPTCHSSIRRWMWFNPAPLLHKTSSPLLILMLVLLLLLLHSSCQNDDLLLAWPPLSTITAALQTSGVHFHLLAP